MPSPGVGLAPSVESRNSTRTPSRGRIEAVDLLRGLLMILMALDHTRDYFSRYTINPVDPTQSWPTLFITRWVAHLCAPGFIALAGASVYLQRQRGKSNSQLAHLLLTRGLCARTFLETYGRVPFFYYVLHIYLLHTAALLGTVALHGDWRFWMSNRFHWGGETLQNWGYSLPVVYAIWLAAVLSLYLPCVWFSRLKGRRHDWWLSYL